MTKQFLPGKFIGIRFTNRLSPGEQKTFSQNPNELYCTAIAKSAKQCKKIIIQTRRHPCAGGNHFVGQKACPFKELADVYINKEHVFQTPAQVKSFLKANGQNPVKTKYLVFEPLKPGSNPGLSSKSAPQTILALVSPETAGRMLGLLAHIKQNTVPDIIPAASTCSAIFRPLLKPDSIHINFIDYFDRYYQCRGLYEPTELIISMIPALLIALIKAYAKSSHGSNKPKSMKIYPTLSL